MKKRRFPIITLSIVVLALLAYWQYDLHKLTYLNAGVLTIKDVPVVVELANNAPKRILGLSNRESLPENSGMLFVFSEPDKYEFWMKDMKIPIDIIWLDKKFKVIDIAQNIKPETYPTIFTAKEKFKYALEVNAGFVESHDIVVGDKASFEAH